MQTLVRPVPKSWIIELYEKCDDLTDEVKDRMKVPRHMNREPKGIGLRTTFEYDPKLLMNSKEHSMLLNLN